MMICRRVTFLTLLCSLISLGCCHENVFSEEELSNLETYTRRFLGGEREIFVSIDDISAKLLTSSSASAKDDALTMLTSSDGDTMIQTIYGHGLVKDCDIVENSEIVDNFTKEVKEIVVNGTDADDDEIRIDEGMTKKMTNFNQQRRECRRFQRNMMKVKRSKSSSKNRTTRQKRSYLIYPGTNWCGKGNTADYAEHLGLQSDVDNCCRTHDQCPFTIDGFSSRFNVFNYRLHTLSHCDCDKQFKDCLKLSETGTANVIGKVYFNVVNTQCFDLKMEKVCSRRTWWGTCDKSQTQWVATVRSLGNY